MPKPSISTGCPAAKPRITILANRLAMSVAAPLSPMLAASMLFEANRAIGAAGESPKSRQFGILPTLQIRDQLADEAVQAVGRFTLGDARLSGKLSGDFRLLHSDFNLAARS